MSVDIFLFAFENGEPQQVSTSAVFACFEQYISCSDDSYLDLRFGPHDSSTIYLDAASTSLSSLTLNRPCTDPRLGQCLYRLMSLGNFVLLDPGGDRALILEQSITVHFPAELLEATGELLVTPDESSFVTTFFVTQ